MATTSPDNIKTPNAGDQYALVQDLGALADTVQSALNRRANLYTGTSAQRAAFAAPEGTHWQDTNGAKGEFVRQSGAWVAWRPVATGNLTLVTAAGGAVSSRSVSLPSGLFTTAPIITLTLRNPLGHHAGLQYRINGRSVSSFSVEGRSFPVGTVGYSIDLDWVASA